MPSWSRLSLLVSLAATLAPLADAGRAHFTKTRVSSHTQRLSTASSTSKDVIVEMFQWSWDSVAAECTNFLGPAGYGYVQGTSPSGSNALFYS